jgi:phage protein D
MAQASAEAGGFYVPQFQISVQGSPLPGGVLHDVVEITYRDKLEEIDSCEITVNNWDATNNCFKYIGAEQLNDKGMPTDGSNPNSKLWTLFDPSLQPVTLHLGYAPGPLEQMLIGAFVSYEPTFPSSGAPVLSVRVLNMMSQLRDTPVSDEYGPDKLSKVCDSAIAQYIDQQQRLPFPIQIKDGAIDAEPDLGYVVQNNQYDVDFLWQRARQNGYDLYLKFDTDGALKLFFQKPELPDTPVYLLQWGQSLIDFQPTLSTGNQFKSLTVRGWDRSKQQPIDDKRDLDSDNVKQINPDLKYMLKQGNARDAVVEHKPYGSLDEAKHYGDGVFHDQLMRQLLATGTTVGLPKLRAGSRVKIGKLGSRLSGVYFVTSTTHVFNSSGYTTRFEARREGPLP